jgi:hypothetical protein
MIEWSPERDKLCAALVAFAKKAKNPTKDKHAKIKTKSGADYEYDYADLGSSIDNLRGPLTEAGLWVVQAATGEYGPAIEITTEVIHESGQWCRSTLVMKRGNTPQEDGSAISYGRRYALLPMLGLMAEADDDGALASQSEERKQRQTKRGEPTTAKPKDPETGEERALSAAFVSVFHARTKDLPDEVKASIISDATEGRTDQLDAVHLSEWGKLRDILEGRK